jgi:hypothetical protein
LLGIVQLIRHAAAFPGWAFTPPRHVVPRPGTHLISVRFIRVPPPSSLVGRSLHHFRVAGIFTEP